jgi:hypothetical protein
MTRRRSHRYAFEACPFLVSPAVGRFRWTAPYSSVHLPDMVAAELLVGSVSPGLIILEIAAEMCGEGSSWGTNALREQKIVPCLVIGMTRSWASG